MKTYFLLLAFTVIAFTSCTSAYKTGQTPDDVYYSQGRERGQADEYVEMDRRDDRAYQHSEDYYEDRYLRYRMRNRYAYAPLDDYYLNPSYAWHYGSYNSWSNPYTSYHCWNNYYNPYYGYGGYGGYYPGGVVIVKSYVNYRPPSRPVVFNSSNYNSNGNSSRVTSRNYTGPRYNNSNSSRTRSNSNSGRYDNNNSFGNSVRRVFNSGSSSSGNNSSSNSTPSRSYNPSSSSSSSSSGSRSSSSGGSSGGGGGVSRPAR